MNRKEEKSIHAIHDALQTLIKQKDYADITISDLIRTSGVSRSTFYAHFKSKDDVLQNVCHAIFHHVFSASLKPEAHHDFSHSLAFDYEHMLMHLFCHFQEEKELIAAILSSSASHEFDASLREEARPLAMALLPAAEKKHQNVPEEVLSSAILGTLVESLHASVATSKQTPEEWTEGILNLFTRSHEAK